MHENDIAPRPVAEPVQVQPETEAYARQARSENTRRAYTTDVRDFEAWCRDRGISPPSAQSGHVADYIAHLADGGRKVATIERRLAALSKAYQAAGGTNPVRSPIVRETFAGIRREKGTAQAQKAPLLAVDVRAMVDALPDSLKGRRDRAMILLGFAGAFRRSELVGLDVEDLLEDERGLQIRLQHSKTDQEGRGRIVGIHRSSEPALCPVRALARWLSDSGIEAGPVFRPLTKAGTARDRRLSDHAVAVVVKDAARLAGLDPSRYSGHSLRAGHVTQARLNGASAESLMRQSGHRSVAMLARYIRVADVFRDNSSARLWEV
jgi:site-specific recombinase XerD